MGRNTKLTPAVHAKIVELIEGGNYDTVAFTVAGVGESTFYRWLEQGEAAQSGKKREFWEAVREARVTAESNMVAIIVAAAPKNFQAAAWYLERKYPDRYGRRVALTGKDGWPIQTEEVTTLADLRKRAFEERQRGDPGELPGTYIDVSAIVTGPPALESPPDPTA